MSKIYFSTGEKEKLKNYISNYTGVFDNGIDIELIKKHHRYKDILLRHTNITTSLIDIIFEYTHEIIVITCKNSYYSFTIILKNIFNLSIRYGSYCHNVHEFKFNIHALMCNNYLLFTRKGLNKKSLPSIITNNKKYDKAYDEPHDEYYDDYCHNEYSLGHFMNYFMKIYYNKKTPYINHFTNRCSKYAESGICGIYNNIYYYTPCLHNTYGIQIIKMLDHKKIKQMIVIVKLLINKKLNSYNV